MQIIRQFFIRPYLYIVISLVGISLKFHQIDHKLFWLDEVSTVQHTSGIPDDEYPFLIPNNEINNIAFYKDLYHLNKQDYKLGSQLKGLFTSTQLNPLYYPFLMIWHRLISDDPVSFRLFGAFLVILTLPFLFLLSRDLFNSNLAGWIAASLYAVSPYIHIFAQEARYYILWSFIIIILHYTLVKAIRVNTAKWWIIYGIIMVMSLFASPISILIIFGHLLFVLICYRNKAYKYFRSILLTFLLYLPWALFLYSKLDAISSALSWQANNEHHVAFWLPLLGQFFYLFSIFSFKLDYFTAFSETSFNLPPQAGSAFLFNFIVIIILGLAIVYLFRQSKKEIIYLLLLIILPGLLFFYVNDLMRDGMTSWWWRYLIFTAVGVFLLMTNYLYHQIDKGNLFAIVGYVALIFIGISSIYSTANARHWGIGSQLNEYINNANLISDTDTSLIITDFDGGKKMVDLMVVLLECKSDNIDILKTSPSDDLTKIRIRQKEYTNIYTLYASDALIDILKNQFDSKMEQINIEGISTIWQIHSEE